MINTPFAGAEPCSNSSSYQLRSDNATPRAMLHNLCWEGNNGWRIEFLRDKGEFSNANFERCRVVQAELSREK